MRRLAHILALSFGAGLSPVWPGTVGAAVGLLFAAALLPLAPALQAGLLAALLLVGIWSSAIVAADTGEDDPQIAVVDGGRAELQLELPEFLDMLCAFALRCAAALTPNPIPQAETLSRVWRNPCSCR